MLLPALTMYCSLDKVSRTTPSASHTEAGTLRKRAQRACGQCHSHKTKCSGDLPRCRRCEASNLVCEYTPTKRKFTNVRYSATNPPPDGTATPTDTTTVSAHSADDTANSPTTSTLHGYHVMLLDPNSLNAEYVYIFPSHRPYRPGRHLLVTYKGLLQRLDGQARHHLPAL